MAETTKVAEVKVEIQIPPENIKHETNQKLNVLSVSNNTNPNAIKDGMQVDKTYVYY